MKKTILILVLICVLTVSACGLIPNADSKALAGTSWSLVSHGGKTLLPGTAMTAVFEKDQVSGTASCNHYFGGYQLKGEKIEISGLGWTEMACMDPEGVMLQEQEIMNQMGNASSFAIQGSQLTIQTVSGEVLVFQQLDSKE